MSPTKLLQITRKVENMKIKKWNINIAILSGDIMLIETYKFLRKTSSNFQQVIDIFNEIAVKVCQGQQWDMDFEIKEKISVEEYLKILPVNTKSDIAIKLAKELLLTTANVPMGEGKEDLMLLRINKLIELGDLNNAHLLIQSLSSDQKKEEILKRELEINLSLNNFDCRSLVIPWFVSYSISLI